MLGSEGPVAGDSESPVPWWAWLSLSDRVVSAHVEMLL